MVRMNQMVTNVVMIVIRRDKLIIRLVRIVVRMIKGKQKKNVTKRGKESGLSTLNSGLGVSVPTQKGGDKGPMGGDSHVIHKKSMWC